MTADSIDKVVKLVVKRKRKPMKTSIDSTSRPTNTLLSYSEESQVNIREITKGEAFRRRREVENTHIKRKAR